MNKYNESHPWRGSDRFRSDCDDDCRIHPGRGGSRSVDLRRHVRRFDHQARVPHGGLVRWLNALKTSARALVLALLVLGAGTVSAGETAILRCHVDIGTGPPPPLTLKITSNWTNFGAEYGPTSGGPDVYIGTYNNWVLQPGGVGESIYTQVLFNNFEDSAPNGISQFDIVPHGASANDFTGGGTVTTHYPNDDNTVHYVDFSWDACPNRSLTFILNLTVMPSEGASLVGPGAVEVVLRVDNAVKLSQSLSLTPGVANNVFNIEQGNVATQGGFTYVWYANNAIVAQGSFQCADEIIDDTVINGAVVRIDGQVGTGTSTDGNGNTTTTTTGSTTPPPPPNTSNPPTPAPPGSTTTTTNSTVNNGGSTTTTNQDMYNNMRQALMDAGNTGTTPNSATWAAYSPPTDGFGEDEAEKTMQDVRNSVNALRGKVDNINGTVSTLMGQATGLMPNLGSVPSPVGTWQFPVPSPVFGVSSFTVNLTPYDDVISMFRACCQMMIAILFYFGVVRYLRSSLADLGR